MADYTVLPPDTQLDAQPPAKGYTLLPPDTQLDGPQMEGFKRPFAMAGSGMLKGAAQTADTFGGAALPDPVANLMVTQAAEKAGEKPSPDGAPPQWQMPQQPLEGPLTKIGAVNRPDLVPQNTAEKGLDSFSTGVGRSLPFGVFGAPVANAISGGVGAVTGDTAADMFPQHRALAEFLGNLIGGGATAAGTAVGKAAVKPLAEFGARSISTGAETDQASQRLLEAMQRDIDSGNVTADAFFTASQRGMQPWQVKNAENTLAIANGLARSGGQARSTIRSYAENEDAGAPGRIDAGVNAAFNRSAPGVDVYDLPPAISQAQKNQAGPLYDQAFGPNGISAAPFKDQYAAAVTDATQRMAVARKAMNAAAAKGQSGASGVAGQQIKQAYDQASQQFTQAQTDRVSALADLRRAQQEITANAPQAAQSAAAWQRLQTDFLVDPAIQEGLRRGYREMQLEARGNHTPFNPTEYGVTGVTKDAAGNDVPTFGQVPNMRMLDMAKRGLDSQIGDQIDDVTGKVSSYGRALQTFRTGYMKELEAISGGPNSPYAQARSVWGSGEASKNAIKMGAGAWNKGSHEIATDLAHLSPNDQVLYRLSALQSDKTGILSKINGGSLGSNEAAKLLANTDQNLKPQLEALFPDQASRDQLLQLAQDENNKFRARTAINLGSKTVDNAADVANLSHGNGNGAALGRAAVGAAATAGHEPFVGMTMIAKAIQDILHNTISVSPKLNANMARQLTQDPRSLAPIFDQLHPMGAPSPHDASRRFLQMLGQSAVPLGLPSPY